MLHYFLAQQNNPDPFELKAQANTVVYLTLSHDLRNNLQILFGSYQMQK